jgi:hypothetical protein
MQPIGGIRAIFHVAAMLTARAITTVIPPTADAHRWAGLTSYYSRTIYTANYDNDVALTWLSQHKYKQYSLTICIRCGAIWQVISARGEYGFGNTHL